MKDSIYLNSDEVMYVFNVTALITAVHQHRGLRVTGAHSYSAHNVIPGLVKVEFEFGVNRKGTDSDPEYHSIMQTVFLVHEDLLTGDRSRSHFMVISESLLQPEAEGLKAVDTGVLTSLANEANLRLVNADKVKGVVKIIRRVKGTGAVVYSVGVNRKLDKRETVVEEFPFTSVRELILAYNRAEMKLSEIQNGEKLAYLRRPKTLNINF